MWFKTVLLTLIAAGFLLPAAPAPARFIPVRQTEGLVHGFLSLRTLDGVYVASGDLLQVARGDVVTTQIVFHFKDGSIHDETAVYSQRDSFRLKTDHLVQKGPAFKDPIDITIDVPANQALIRTWDDKGVEKTETKRMELPPDLANGMLITLLKNIRASDLPVTVSFLAASASPRLVKLVITAAGTEGFATAEMSRTATNYAIKVDIGGLAGFVAPFVGKQPPDYHVWILGGAAPAFVKSEAPLAVGGPPLRIELVSPAWPQPPKR